MNLFRSASAACWPTKPLRLILPDFFIIRYWRPRNAGRDQGQQRIHHQQHCQDPRKPSTLVMALARGGTDKVGDRVDVRWLGAHELAVGVAVKDSHGQCLHPGRKLRPQVWLTG